MKNIKTLLVVTVLLLAMSASVSAQENHGKALNAFVKFGENSSLGAFYEFQVHPDITVSPEARIWFGDDNKIAIGGRADYLSVNKETTYSPRLSLSYYIDPVEDINEYWVEGLEEDRFERTIRQQIRRWE